MGTIFLGAFLNELGKELGGFTAKELISALKRAKGSCGKLVAKYFEQNKKKSTEELLNTEISPEMKEELEKYMAKRNDPHEIDGVDFFFEENVSDEDAKILKSVLQHVNPDWDGRELINADVLKHQEILDDQIIEYVNEYINNEIDEDYGITEDNLYINFDENKELEYDEDVEADICQMKDALNHLLAAFGSNNKIVRHLFY